MLLHCLAIFWKNELIASFPIYLALTAFGDPAPAPLAGKGDIAAKRRWGEGKLATINFTEYDILSNNKNTRKLRVHNYITFRLSRNFAKNYYINLILRAQNNTIFLLGWINSKRSQYLIGTLY